MNRSSSTLLAASLLALAMTACGQAGETRAAETQADTQAEPPAVVPWADGQASDAPSGQAADAEAASVPVSAQPSDPLPIRRGFWGQGACANLTTAMVYFGSRIGDVNTYEDGSAWVDDLGPVERDGRSYVLPDRWMVIEPISENRIELTIQDTATLSYCRPDQVPARLRQVAERLAGRTF